VPVHQPNVYMWAQRRAIVLAGWEGSLEVMRASASGIVVIALDGGRSAVADAELSACSVDMFGSKGR
jgi:hypothetical protein